ncbi:orotate phosphoribosyltransferase [Desulfosudis oleivorans]|uniref:Orotate phosphoribosyltransferase n=1 Tax=Desulfosudis oleivorans (strain DSM 6200 / JCM 39069 / Hxd3) TaxID=96561 RepID=A9A061_DESOH|nr:orotate phosphoribosyltransferase [Desulfosudis oleivorans]ABW68980.1 orotate phosphoribosyltransferase [Desulfosudis oleivorans Hxd3]
MNDRQRLIELIRQRAYRRTETPEITLASGKKSCFYFNLKKVICSSEGQYLSGRLVYDKIMALGLAPDGVGGLTMGADPISYATAYTFHLNHGAVEAFSIRKEPKDHGAGLQIEGNIGQGARVIITEDVVTTGGSTIKAITIARAHGLQVMGVIALLDRCEENGRQNIEAQGVPMHAILSIADFK